MFFFQIVNDTVGTLLAHAYRYPETAMGVIMGTGSNACKYMKGGSIESDDSCHVSLYRLL